MEHNTEGWNQEDYQKGKKKKKKNILVFIFD